MTIVFRGYAMRSLHPAYRGEAEFTGDDVSVFAPSAEVEKIDIAPGGQLMLMPLPEVSKPPLSPIVKKRKTGNAGVPGEGPAGETCGSCASYIRVRGGAGTFLKCELMRAKWTKGPGSDIRKSDPACGRWEAKGVRS